MLPIAIAGFVIFVVILIWMLARNSEGSPSASFSSNIKLGSLPEKLIASLGTVNLQTKIIFNGKEYAGPEDMPPEVRKMYDGAMTTVLADENSDGIPDVFQGQGGKTIVHTGFKQLLPDDAELKTHPRDDPAETLKVLREMKATGLITEQEFETKKAEILSRM